MKTTQVEIPNGKKAELVEGVLTLIDDKPQDTHVYKVGDKAVLNKDTSFKKGDGVCLITKGNVVEIIYASYPNSHLFDIKFENAISTVRGEDLTPVITQDITDRIKTFEDAVKWCNEKGYDVYTSAYNVCNDVLGSDNRIKDILAYLKLRIITCALNEGHEIDIHQGDKIYSISCDQWDNELTVHENVRIMLIPKILIFKSKELALYAATQFKDIYLDFYYKGKE